LQALNSEYADKRTSGRLDPPVLKVVQRGESLRYRRQRVMNGTNDGQFKTLKLTDNPDYANHFTLEEEMSLSEVVSDT
ncbi:MAG TPA: GH3 auxin-responsive promoter family protein, partial [bacterium]|nr:GH3 auxin-responsive promoter family protein [bacterium]